MVMLSYRTYGSPVFTLNIAPCWRKIGPADGWRMRTSRTVSPEVIRIPLPSPSSFMLASGGKGSAERDGNLEIELHEVSTHDRVLAVRRDLAEAERLIEREGFLHERQGV